MTKLWIKTSDRLPNDMDVVLVWSTTSLKPTIAYFFQGDWLYYSINQECFWLKNHPHIVITHWQPLPSNPIKNMRVLSKAEHLRVGQKIQFLDSDTEHVIELIKPSVTIVGYLMIKLSILPYNPNGSNDCITIGIHMEHMVYINSAYGSII